MSPGTFGKSKAAMVSVTEARDIILSKLPERKVRQIPLHDALGHVLAIDIPSDIDMPPFDRSAMDGYALRAEDATSVPAVLRVVGSIAAGQMPDRLVGSGEAVKIMTGAPLPPGANAVQMVERTRSPRAGEVEILDPVAAGDNVARRAEDLARGDLALRAHTYLSGPEIGLLASVGRTEVPVFAPPRVAVLSTGNELVSADVVPGPSQIRNGNGPTLMAMARAERCTVDDLGIARDEPRHLRELVARGLEADLLVVTGGVSMGEHDLVDGIFRELSVTLHVESVKVKPGKPMVFGTSPRGSLCFGLPGNPLSCVVTFVLLVAPAIRALRALPKTLPARCRARLRKRVKGDKRRVSYVRCVLDLGTDGFTCEPVSWHGSADLVAFSRGNALVEVPEGCPSLEVGDMADVLFEETFLWR